MILVKLFSQTDQADKQNNYFQVLELNQVAVLSVQLKEYAIPENYTLSQNYPNPFNPVTTIEFGLPKPGFVEISIYDINGKLVRKLVSQQRSAGNHIIIWNANDELGNRMTSGIY